MIQKNEFPILEYDFDSTEILKPNHGAEQLTLPEKCVFAFLGDTIDTYAAEMGETVAEHFETITKTYPIYVIKNDGEEFCLCQAPLGAPAAAQFMDCLIACGCRKIITAGSCGVLTEMAENEFLIPTKALRDEGTSYPLSSCRPVCRTGLGSSAGHRKDLPCAGSSLPRMYHMDDGRFFPGNERYGGVPESRRLRNGRNGMCRPRGLRQEARSSFWTNPVYGGFPCKRRAA